LGKDASGFAELLATAAGVMPLDLILWHDKYMSNPSNKDDAENDGGGISSAIAQDIELTIEQVEEAAKKAAHAAAVALGLSKDDAPADFAADPDASASSEPEVKSKP
jgi:hypothetical protein